MFVHTPWNSPYTATSTSPPPQGSPQTHPPPLPPHPYPPSRTSLDPWWGSRTTPHPGNQRHEARDTTTDVLGVGSVVDASEYLKRWTPDVGTRPLRTGPLGGQE